MNPYESPKTEQPHLDKPVEAEMKYHHPAWQRVLALSVPFSAGFLSLFPRTPGAGARLSAGACSPPLVQFLALVGNRPFVGRLNASFSP